MKRRIVIKSSLLWCAFFLVTACTTKQSSVKTYPVTDISVTQAMEIHKSQKDVIFLDVRTPEETADGTVVNAMILNFRDPDFEDNLSLLDREKSYIVYCKSGNRSARTAKTMEDMGFKKVNNMLGGFEAWQDQNK